MTSPKVFVVTGCSSGLGTCLARAILKSSPTTGHKLIATSRDPSKTPELVKEIESQGGTWLPLDVGSPSTLAAQAEAVFQVYGKIDVLINNAGTGVAGSVEDRSVDEARFVFEANFFGPLQLIKQILPSMRERGSGTIVNISSSSVYQAPPTLGIYAASKSALDSISASLASEVAGFGVRVIVPVPGGMTTNLTDPEKMKKQFDMVSDAYKGTPVEYVFQHLANMQGKWTIDPQKAAERIIEAVDGSGTMEGKTEGLLRLPIGLEAGKGMKAWGEGFMAAVDKYENVWSSVEYPEGQ